MKTPGIQLTWETLPPLLHWTKLRKENENLLRNAELGRRFKRFSYDAENRLYSLVEEDVKNTFTSSAPDPTLICSPSPKRIQIGLTNQAIVSLLQKIHKELKIVTKKISETEKNNTAASQWKFAAMVVDRFCFYLFSFFILTTTVVIMIFAPYLIA